MSHSELDYILKEDYREYRIEIRVRNFFIYPQGLKDELLVETENHKESYRRTIDIYLKYEIHSGMIESHIGM